AAVGVLDRMLGIAAGRLQNTGSFLSQMVQWGDAARKRAITDAYTGLFNRRYLEDNFESLVSRARRDVRELSFAMFDLDRFGKLNSTYGAEFCDRVILRVSETFREVFGEDDTLVRYGGDEFCFVIQGLPPLALAKCEAVCASLRALAFPEHPELRISCSIGLAHFPSAATTALELKERADKALYLAKEAGRDRAIAWPGTAAEESKRAIPTIAGKNRAVASVVSAIEHGDFFLIAGHKDPDEDCVSSMVAFALLVTKLGKKASIVLGSSVQGTYTYLLKICRYNSIEIISAGPLPRPSVLVFVDTPKPAHIDRKGLYEDLLADASIPKLELDHHLGADSVYIGDRGLRLVYEASSTCEIIGHLAMKMEADAVLMARYEIGELLSRNLVLAILSGMISDSQMGKFLKSRRERWFYERFSSLFEEILLKKTHSGSGNFSSKEQVFEALAALSEAEDACFRFMSKNAVSIGRVRYAVLDADSSSSLFATWGNETVVIVAKALVDTLAETSGSLGLVGFYDDPANSPFVQFRLRRSQAFTALDLRDAIARIGMTNGGGHPGAVGFRIEREAMPDIAASAKEFALSFAKMVEETAGT
ncbi:MAG: diguanylate cyclase, partial [Spirochaetota bacterium]